MHQNDGRSSRCDSITASPLNVSQAVALFNIVVGLVVTDVPESLPDGRRSLRLRSGRRQIADMPPVTNVRFYIDPESGEPHLYRHRVTVEEAEAVLSRPLEDRLGHDGARVAIGQTHAGR